jgi:outer membrane protein
VVMAGVRAARLSVDSATFDARHLRAASVLQSSIAYWNYLAAVRRVGVFRESEELARQIADQTRVLIGAGMRPAVDEKQVDANLANSISQRIAGEQALYQARYDLGLAMGLGFESMGTLPLPTDPFPDVPSDLPGLEALATMAVANRNDLHSRERFEQSSNQQLISVRDGVKQKLDLTANAGYAGLSEGAEVWRYLTPLAVRPTGPNVTVGLAWTAFRGNNAALGRLARSQSELNQARLETFDLRRGILASVAVAYNDLQAAALRLQSSRDASRLYRSAVDDQRQLQQMGVATILDLITTQSRLTQSALDELTAQQDFAIALTQVRFETATLIDDNGQPSTTSLTALPR